MMPSQLIRASNFSNTERLQTPAVINMVIQKSNYFYHVPFIHFAGFFIETSELSFCDSDMDGLICAIKQACARSAFIVLC